MYNVQVQLTKTDTALPSGVSFANTVLTVTDSAGAVQTFTLSAPWTQAVTIAADGQSSYSAQDTDTNGNPIGAAVTTVFTPAATTFPATGAITVTSA